MESVVKQLTDLVTSPDAFDFPFSEILPLQIQGINERLAEQVDRIPLLRHRVDSTGVAAITGMADIVPLLFAHTAYKNYPENWLLERKWDRLGRWLATVSAYPVNVDDTGAIETIDDWLQALAEHGHYVSCSSGTTGKCAMMDSSAKDLKMAGDSLLQAHEWATGFAPQQDRHVLVVAPVATTPRNMASQRAIVAGYGAPDLEPFFYPGPPMTMGGITEMVVLNKKIAEGTALPADIARYQGEVAAREQSMDEAVDLVADTLIASRNRKLFIIGLFGPMYHVAERVRAKGYDASHFHPENTGFIGGGLKRANVPDNYEQYIFDTFNLSTDRLFHAYGMQELNTNAVRCRAGRYHVAPWVMLLLLDDSGEILIEPASGEQEGRAGLFDLSMDGRWGGVITGDKVKVTYDPCSCGAKGPSVGGTISRYADLVSGDKIACSGNIDAYVRGVT